jgi:hypothetical protein
VGLTVYLKKNLIKIYQCCVVGMIYGLYLPFWKFHEKNLYNKYISDHYQIQNNIITTPFLPGASIK